MDREVETVLLVQKFVKIIQAGLNSEDPDSGETGLVLFFIVTAKEDVYGKSDYR